MGGNMFEIVSFVTDLFTIAGVLLAFYTYLFKRKTIKNYINKISEDNIDKIFKLNFEHYEEAQKKLVEMIEGKKRN